MNSEAPHPFFFNLPSWGRSFISYPAGFWLLLVRKSMGSCWEGRGGVGVGDRASVPTCRPARTLRASVHAVMGSLDPTLWFTEWLMGSCWVWPLSSLPAGKQSQNGKWQVRSDCRAAEPRVAMPVTWLSWRRLLLRALVPLLPELIWAAITDCFQSHALIPRHMALLNSAPQTIVLRFYKVTSVFVFSRTIIIACKCNMA